MEQPKQPQQHHHRQHQHEQIPDGNSEDDTHINAATKKSDAFSSPPAISIISEPVLELLRDHDQQRSNDEDLKLAPPQMDNPSTAAADPKMTSISSSFRINVVNNKSLDEQHVRHHQGLLSSDEGLYLSEVNLSSLAQEQQQLLHHQQAAHFSSSTSRLVPPYRQEMSPVLGRIPDGATTEMAVDARPRIYSSESDPNSEFLCYDDAPDPEQDTSETGPLTNLGGGDNDKNMNNNMIEPPTRSNEPQALSSEESTAVLAVSSRSIHDGVAVPPNGNHISFYGAVAVAQHLENHNSGVTDTFASSSAGETTSSSVSQFKGESIWVSLHNIAERCLQPPVIGAISGILVAISPARGLLVDVVDRDNSAPLEWLFDGLYSVGLTAVPINMIILGCNLSNSYNKLRLGNSSSTGGSGAEVIVGNVGSLSKNDKEGLLDLSTMIGIVVGKMIVMPIIGFFSAWFLDNFVLDIPSDNDGAFYLALLIVFLTPTANNVMVMVELSGSNTKEGIASVIAMQFAVAPIILSCTLTMAIGYARGMQ